MRITYRKISDETNELGFEEIVLLNRNIAAFDVNQTGKIAMQYQWLAILDGQLHNISEEELMNSLHCYEILESDKVEKIEMCV